MAVVHSQLGDAIEILAGLSASLDTADEAQHAALSKVGGPDSCHALLLVSWIAVALRSHRLPNPTVLQCFSMRSCSTLLAPAARFTPPCSRRARWHAAWSRL